MIKLICISTTAYSKNKKKHEVSCLKKGKTYEGTPCKMLNGMDGYNIEGFGGSFSAYLFYTIAEWREQQINSILND